MLTIWHNPRCTKSRQTLALIENAGIAPTVRLYLDDPPNHDELADALRMLNMEPWQLARMGEPLAKDAGAKDLVKDHSAREEWIEVMCANPRLIERPVVITDDGQALLGRPPENVEALLRSP